MGERTYLLTVMAGVDAHLSEPAWVLHSGLMQSAQCFGVIEVPTWALFRAVYLVSRWLLLLTISPALGTASGDFPAWAEEIQLTEMVLFRIFFAEHYEIVKEIGFGGMGIVYMALTGNLAGDVAVKVLHGHRNQIDKQEAVRARGSRCHDALSPESDFCVSLRLLRSRAALSHGVYRLGYGFDDLLKGQAA